MAAGKKIPSSFIKWILACSQSDETPATYPIARLVVRAFAAVRAACSAGR
jgi:hypothetical protein